MSLIESGSESSRGERYGRIARWAGAGTAVGVLVVGLYTATSTPEHEGAPPSAPGAGPPTTVGAAVPDKDPLLTARRWLEGTRAISYQDPDPLVWTQRVAPLLSGSAATENTAAGQSSASGAGWNRMVQDQCSTSVSEVDAVIPPEAPRSDQQVFVQVAGTIRTGCTAPDAVPIPPERAAATLGLVVGSDGLWRVDQRLY